MTEIGTQETLRGFIEIEEGDMSSNNNNERIIVVAFWTTVTTGTEIDSREKGSEGVASSRLQALASLRSLVLCLQLLPPLPLPILLLLLPLLL